MPIAIQQKKQMLVWYIGNESKDKKHKIKLIKQRKDEYIATIDITVLKWPLGNLNEAIGSDEYAMKNFVDANSIEW
jgi:hypothetical protein